jgi:transcriptional regulator with XRE-family HTH domain
VTISPYQIRAIRDHQELSQEKLAEMVGMNQNAISRLESPDRGRPTITTLKRLAKAFDVGLVVAFVPFSQLVRMVSGIPFVQRGLSTDYLTPESFHQEQQAGTFRFDDATSLPIAANLSVSSITGNVYGLQSSSADGHWRYKSNRANSLCNLR